MTGEDVPSGDATRLLARIAEGDRSAEAELFRLVGAELSRLARSHMARETPEHTLQPTALVSEAYLAMFGDTLPSFASRGHFYAMASKVMRSILVDHARRKKAAKRGGDRVRVSLADADRGVSSERELELLEVHEAVEDLTDVSPDLGRLAEVRLFGGLTLPQAAEALETPLRTIERRWKLANAWLKERLTDEPSSPGSADR